MKRDVVVLLTRAPYGRVHVAEGLRAARGVAAGFDRHDVTVVYTEDAVFVARTAVNRERLNMTDHIEDLHAEDGRMIVDRYALDARNIDANEIADDIAVRDEGSVAEIVRTADHTLDF
jgi:sulfur relay (sulfurtransferase) DsrF/TusC family protein